MDIGRSRHVEWVNGAPGESKDKKPYQPSTSKRLRSVPRLNDTPVSVLGRHVALDVDDSGLLSGADQVGHQRVALADPTVGGL